MLAEEYSQYRTGLKPETFDAESSIIILTRVRRGVGARLGQSFSLPVSAFRQPRLHANFVNFVRI
jgi:hypothetical protein